MLWQSFDVPTDTYLPGMKLGWYQLNSYQSLYHFLVSWVNPQNPAPGNFTLAMHRINFTKISVWQGDNNQMDLGFWDGHKVRFIFDNSTSGNDYNFSYHSNADDAYFTFSGNKTYDLMWFVMSSTGKLGSLPSTFNSGSINMGTRDCESWCRSNCSCTAFASPDQNDQVWQLYYGSRHDLLKIIDKEGTAGVIYIRGGAPSGGKKWKLRLALTVSLASLLVLVPVSLCCYLRWRKGHKENAVPDGNINLEQASLFHMATNASPVQQNAVRGANNMELGRQKDQDLPLFSFSTIQTATNYFAESNKLREGGYGPVYKARFQFILCNAS
ncbi:hypothetical protein ACLB2K_014572 [Fragaria x ananassa]